MPGINHDLKVVVELLRHIAARLIREDSARHELVAGNSEVDCAVGIKNPDFCVLGSMLPLVGFLLSEVGNWSCLLPDWIVKGAIQLWWRFNPNRPGNSQGLDGCRAGLLRPLASAASIRAQVIRKMNVSLVRDVM